MIGKRKEILDNYALRATERASTAKLAMVIGGLVNTLCPLHWDLTSLARMRHISHVSLRIDHQREKRKLKGNRTVTIINSIIVSASQPLS